MAGKRDLRRLFEPRSVAMIGASEKSLFSHLAAQCLAAVRFEGPVFAVNPGANNAHGFPGFTSCKAIGQLIDAAYVAVPARFVIEAVEEAAEAGIRNFVVVSSGFGEVGGGAAEAQAALGRFCALKGINMLGPNGLGYFNLLDRTALGALTVSELPDPGAIAIVSASGAVASQMLRFCKRQAVGVSHAIALGNEADVSSADILSYLVDHPRVRAIAMFQEAVKDPEGLAIAAAAARNGTKPIVVLKAGSSERAGAVAAAHTGALVGDDSKFNAFCDKFGLLRVRNLEDLIVTAATIAETGPLTRPGVGFVSTSGGACEIIADIADECGLDVPEFSPPVHAVLLEKISAGGMGQSVNNPLDLTGAVARDPSLWESVMDQVIGDPRIGVAVAHMDPPSQWGSSPVTASVFRHIACTMRRNGKQALMMATYAAAMEESDHAFKIDAGVGFILPSIATGIPALVNAARWTENLSRGEVNWSIEPPTRLSEQDRPKGEFATLRFLEQWQVPTIPQTLCLTAQEAQRAAERIDGPVAMKIAAPEILHKTDVGGVLLNVQGVEAIEHGFSTIMQAVRGAVPGVHPEGVLISPMRGRGIELLVAVTHDVDWGYALTLGFGGTLVEVLSDSTVLLLPAGHVDIVRHLSRLRGARLFAGVRGDAAIDVEELARVIHRISDAAVGLGPSLDTLEINPLLVTSESIEALDALIIWKQPA